MYNDKKIAVVMPAYNAEKTLRRTFDEVCAQRIVDVVIVVDDEPRKQSRSDVFSEKAGEMLDALLNVNAGILCQRFCQFLFYFFTALDS